MGTPSKKGHLLIWGESESGKSTLLAVGLKTIPFETVPINWDRRDSGSKERETFSKGWTRVSMGYSIGQTQEIGSRFDLPLAMSDSVLHVEDIQGTMSKTLNEAMKRLPEGEPAAVIFVCRWPSKTDDRTRDDITSIEAILRNCEGRKIGLALTKCDRGLEANDPHWLAPFGWWRDHECWLRHADVLGEFGGAVWPTSAFGFDAEGRPACLLGEFGQALPFNVRPLNADAPFRWVFKELGLWPN